MKNATVAMKDYADAKWQDVLDYPPRYFYDAHTRTLGLDG